MKIEWVANKKPSLIMKVLITITKDINAFKIEMQKKPVTASANFLSCTSRLKLYVLYRVCVCWGGGARACVCVCVGTSILKP
jgi:hypothetical protein